MRELCSEPPVLLADAGSFPLGHALATLALEEVGKSGLCAMVAILPSESVDPADFWKAFRDHEGKLMRMRGYALLVSELPGPVRELAGRARASSAAAHKRKLRGLYVGYDAGRMLLPGEITEAEAREVIDEAQQALDGADRALAPADSRDQMRAFAQTDVAGLFRVLAGAADHDPDALVAAFRAVIAGDPSQMAELLNRFGEYELDDSEDDQTR